MDFYPYEAFDKNESQKKLWEQIKKAFKDDDGVAYYRYPIFTKTGNLNREPDILILHREFGIWIIECKGCYVNNIRTIQGHEWQMSNWYDEFITPVAQAEDQMFAISNKLNRRDTRGLVKCNFRVALPNINKKAWEELGFSNLPTVEGNVLVYEDLTPASLRKHIRENSISHNLTDEQWKTVQGVLGGTLPDREPRKIPAGTPSDNPLRVIREIESQLRTLDEIQQKIAFEIPDGPQRLRGLAGTGKTVLLAKRAAKIHIKHPDWKIAFIFFTRSLYDQVTDLISLYHREMHPDNEEPNFNNLQILHSWGARDQNGFYRKLAYACGKRPKSVNDVKNEVGSLSPAGSFEYICNCLESEVRDIPEIYDALLIDEGQDLPPSFYRLSYLSLKDPKRLYWAYDEAQGIGSLLVPEASEIFGRDPNGDLIVDLRGSYEGGISKGHRMNKCYRTPKLLLMVAHSINMGLFREGGALQGVTTKNDWEALGYSVEGNFNKIGSLISIAREDEKSPHPIDNPDFESKEALGDILKVVSFNNEFEEQQWIAQQVAEDVRQGFNPWDIMITALVGDDERDYLNNMKSALQNYNIPGYIAGTGGNRNNFRIDNHVTIANIFRAKGNEAWKVYICRFHYVNEPIAWRGETELHKRNEAFVGLTRSRVWGVVTGIGADNTGIFAELSKPISQFPTCQFPAFNRSSLKRQSDTDDSNISDLPLFSDLEKSY